ncbi:MAG TPA: YCF48-related protein, partial [Ignavibacteriales bacterium]|nr:YCF48-related protein [Ignavibacteriales bacterium]
SPTSQQLNSIAFANASTAVAVGYNGTIIRSTNGGLTWQNITSPTSQQLNSIAFANASTAVAVGYNGTIIRSTDGGQNWTNIYHK